MEIDRITYLTGIILMIFLFSCNHKQETHKVNKLPYFNSYELTPQWGTPLHKISDFSLLNQEGDTITGEDYKGKIYVSSFFFTSCVGICNKLMANMYSLQEAYKNDNTIKLISHSVTPNIDSVTRLKKYADFKNINVSKWNLVTGDKEEIYKLARDSYFSDDDFLETQKPSSFIHSENFLLIDPNGNIRGVYNGTLKIEMKRIQKHIKVLKKEFNI